MKIKRNAVFFLLINTKTNTRSCQFGGNCLSNEQVDQRLQQKKIVATDSQSTIQSTTQAQLPSIG